MIEEAGSEVLSGGKIIGEGLWWVMLRPGAPMKATLAAARERRRDNAPFPFSANPSPEWVNGQYWPRGSCSAAGSSKRKKYITDATN